MDSPFHAAQTNLSVDQTAAFFTRVDVGTDSDLIQVVGYQGRNVRAYSTVSLEGSGIFTPWGLPTDCALQPSPGAALIPLEEGSYIEVPIRNGRIFFSWPNGGMSPSLGQNSRASFLIGKFPGLRMLFPPPAPRQFVITNHMTAPVNATKTTQPLLNELNEYAAAILPVTALNVFDFGASRVITDMTVSEDAANIGPAVPVGVFIKHTRYDGSGIIFFDYQELYYGTPVAADTTIGPAIPPGAMKESAIIGNRPRRALPYSPGRGIAQIYLFLPPIALNPRTYHIYIYGSGYVSGFASLGTVNAEQVYTG